MGTSLIQENWVVGVAYPVVRGNDTHVLPALVDIRHRGVPVAQWWDGRSLIRMASEGQTDAHRPHP